LAIRYRLPATNSDVIKNAEFYLSSTETSAGASSVLDTAHVLVNDGNWHVLILDAASWGNDCLVEERDGSYRLSFLRWDVFNAQFTTDVYFDVEYIGFDNDLSTIIELNSDLETVTLITEKNKYAVIDTESGETVSTVNPAPLVKPRPSDNGESIKMELSLEALKSKFAAVSNCFESVEIIDEAYLRAHPTGSMAETYATVYTAGNIVTGQYLIIKYRIPTTNVPNMNMELYTSTTGMDGIAKHNLSVKTFSDGEWHTVIVDLSLGGTSEYYIKNDDGKYVASYLRMDILNYKASADEYIDIASVAFADDLEAAKSYDKSGSVVGVYDIKAGEYVE
jgi:hypothetical protein